MTQAQREQLNSEMNELGSQISKSAANAHKQDSIFT